MSLPQAGKLKCFLNIYIEHLANISLASNFIYFVPATECACVCVSVCECGRVHGVCHIEEQAETLCQLSAISIKCADNHKSCLSRMFLDARSKMERGV